MLTLTAPVTIFKDGHFVLAAPEPSGGEARPELDALHRRYREGHASEVGVEGAEDGLADPYGQVQSDAFDYPAEAVAFPPALSSIFLATTSFTS